jgi:frataxin-like iron-binding protein CyaY
LDLIRTTLDGYERSFEVLKKENNAGHIKIEKTEDDLTIHVKDIGSYKFYSDATIQVLAMQSPSSGLYNYYWDEDNKFWKSKVQEHFIDDLLIREFIGHSKGLLML